MNNENQSVGNASCVVHTYKKLSWSAIFSGAFIGLGLGFLLQLYAVAIGLGVFSSSATGAVVVAAGGILGLLVGVVASMIAAGYATGYLARGPGAHKHLGIVYGFTMWSVALVLSALLVMPVSQYISTWSKNLAPAGREVAEKINTAKTTSGHVTHNTGNEQAKALTPVEMTWTAWIIFVVFFVGAFSACLGACWGLGCKSDHENG